MQQGMHHATRMEFGEGKETWPVATCCHDSFICSNLTATLPVTNIYFHLLRQLPGLGLDDLLRQALGALIQLVRCLLRSRLQLLLRDLFRCRHSLCSRREHIV